MQRTSLWTPAALTAAVLAVVSQGCGREIIPIPLPCPECSQTDESECSYFTLADGTRIRSEYIPGDPSLPLVVGVHGCGGTYADAAIIFPRGEFPTLSFSLPGGLCSDTLPEGTPHTVESCGVTLDGLLEHRSDLIEEFGEENVLIAGASFGALVVAEYFAKHPDSRYGAVVITGQDTPLNNEFVDFIDGYLTAVHGISPFINNQHLQEYLASTRVFDVSELMPFTQNHWLIVCGSDDGFAPDGEGMAARLGDRARYFEFEGNHFITAYAGPEIRQMIMDNLDFLLPDRPAQ